MITNYILGQKPRSDFPGNVLPVPDFVVQNSCPGRQSLADSQNDKGHIDKAFYKKHHNIELCPGCGIVGARIFCFLMVGACMAINMDGVYVMLYLKSTASEGGGVFQHTLMVGRQAFIPAFESLNKILKKYDACYSSAKTLSMKAEYGRPLKVSEQLRLPFHYSEELFKYFGAEVVDSIDNSGYENATIIRDLNIPVDNSLKGKYSCVWDGGTLEHIFNYPVALKNCMDMVEAGGYLVMQTPANNQFGHGFYQLQPDIFFSVLCEQNGFTGTKVLMQDDWKRWYEVVPPKIIKDRVEICLSKKPCNLTVISKKTGDVPDVLNIQQEYFVDIWTNKNTKWSSSPLLEKMFKVFAPVRICQFIYFNIFSRLLEGRRKKQFFKPIRLVQKRNMAKTV